MTHLELCREVLAAIRTVAEKNGLHINQSGDAVKQLVSATARASLAIAESGDRKAEAVSVFRDRFKTVCVVVKSGDDFLDVECA